MWYGEGSGIGSERWRGRRRGGHIPSAICAGAGSGDWPHTRPTLGRTRTSRCPDGMDRLTPSSDSGPRGGCAAGLTAIRRGPPLAPALQPTDRHGAKARASPTDGPVLVGAATARDGLAQQQHPDRDGQVATFHEQRSLSQGAARRVHQGVGASREGGVEGPLRARPLTDPPPSSPPLPSTSSREATHLRPPPASLLVSLLVDAIPVAAGGAEWPAGVATPGGARTHGGRGRRGHEWENCVPGRGKVGKGQRARIEPASCQREGRLPAIAPTRPARSGR